MVPQPSVPVPPALAFVPMDAAAHPAHRNGALALPHPQPHDPRPRLDPSAAHQRPGRPRLPLGGLHQHALWPAWAARLQTGYPGDQPILDALPRPVPKVLHVGSLRQVAPQLGLNTSGRQQEHLKSAFHQNASAYIVTKLRYRDRDGRQRRLEAGFTRYSVIFRGSGCPMAPQPTPSTWSSASPIGRSSTMPRCGRSTIPTCRPSRPWPNGSTNS